MRLILASASPRRAELLTAAGIPFDVLSAEVDESVLPGEAPEDYVRRLAGQKAAAVANSAAGRPVLAADTVVLAGGEILGKPRDAADAGRMLRLLSGARHEVMTGVCLMAPAVRLKPDTTPAVRLKADTSEVAEVGVAVTIVEFAALSEADVAWYVASGEPMDKAGAYAIQGLASRFVIRIDGSYSNVVGLPVALVYEMCRRAGLLLS